MRPGLTQSDHDKVFVRSSSAQSSLDAIRVVLEGCEIHLDFTHMATHALARTPMPHAHDAPTQSMPPRDARLHPAPKRKHDPALLV